MNRDDIIRMALEAGFLDRKESCPLSGESRFDEEICVGEYPVGEIVEHFAALVAAHEREECAKLCERAIESIWHGHSRIVIEAATNVCNNLAKVIRVKGEI